MVDCIHQKLYKHTKRFIFRRDYKWHIILLTIAISLAISITSVSAIGNIGIINFIIWISACITIMLLFFILALWIRGQLNGYPDMNIIGSHALGIKCPKILRLVLNNWKHFDLGHMFLNALSFNLELTGDQVYFVKHIINNGILSVIPVIPDSSTECEKIIDILKEHQILVYNEEMWSITLAKYNKGVEPYLANV